MYNLVVAKHLCCFKKNAVSILSLVGLAQNDRQCILDEIGFHREVKEESQSSGNDFALRIPPIAAHLLLIWVALQSNVGKSSM